MPASTTHHPPVHILPIIVVSQVAGTSLWFAGNAVMGNLQQELGLPLSAVGHITSAVQLGFIGGTLVFALLTLADRYSPAKLFFACSLLGALANLGVLLANSTTSLLFLRMLTGFFLAGIYPVGMKIAADWHEKGLGKALGYLVGALVLGTASPHLLKALSASMALPWQVVFLFTSGFAVLGGVLIRLLVPDGPFRRKSQGFKPSALIRVFENKPFRAAAFAYFGHMWELYTFWAFVPLVLLTYTSLHPQANIPVSALAFCIIAIGSLSCVGGGYLSIRRGSAWVGFWALLLSFCCCLASAFVYALPLPLFLAFLLFWGMVVIADSPQFSTLVAQHAPKEISGTALTIVNCLGFSITIVSLQVFYLLDQWILPRFYLTFLALGPLIGLLSLKRLYRPK